MIKTGHDRGKPSGVKQVSGGFEVLAAECGGATEDWTRGKLSGVQQVSGGLEVLVAQCGGTTEVTGEGPARHEVEGGALRGQVGLVQPVALVLAHAPGTHRKHTGR